MTIVIARVFSCDICIMYVSVSSQSCACMHLRVLLHNIWYVIILSLFCVSSTVNVKRKSANKHYHILSLMLVYNNNNMTRTFVASTYRLTRRIKKKSEKTPNRHVLLLFYRRLRDDCRRNNSVDLSTPTTSRRSNPVH